jgi:multidrug efflux pump
MVAGTFLGIFFIPLFFVVVERLFVRREKAPAASAPISTSQGVPSDD